MKEQGEISFNLDLIIPKQEQQLMGEEFLLNKQVDLDSYHLGWPKYLLTIKEDRVQIDLGRQDPSTIELFYKIQDGQVQWLEIKDDHHFNLYLFLRHINNRAINYEMKKWLSVPGRVPIRLYDVYVRLKQYQVQRCQKIYQEHLQSRQKKEKEEIRLRKFKEQQIRNVRDIECIFCATLMNPQAQEKIHQLNCGHCFHKSCITKYCKTVKNQCPVCRYTPKVK